MTGLFPTFLWVGLGGVGCLFGDVRLVTETSHVSLVPVGNQADVPEESPRPPWGCPASKAELAVDGGWRLVATIIAAIFSSPSGWTGPVDSVVP